MEFFMKKNKSLRISGLLIKDASGKIENKTKKRIS